MNGKQMLGVIFIAVLIGGGGSLLLSKYLNTTKEKTLIKNTAKVPVATPTIKINYLTWNDEAGFTFQYPEGVKIDNHPDDEVNYANLTLTSSDGSGNINILMTDDKYKSLDKWINSDSLLKSGTIIDTKLGDKDGNKILTTNGVTTIGVIDSGVLVLLKNESGGSSLLETTWGKIIDSWQFVYPTPTVGSKKVINTDNSSQDSGGDALEEE